MIEVGSLQLQPLEARDHAGETPGRVAARGEAQVYSVRGPDRLRLEVGDISWANGERSVETLRVLEGPTQMRRLDHGARLTVSSVGDDVCFDLRLLRVKLGQLNRWSSALFKCSPEDLNLASGVDVGEVLRAAGAARIGHRSALIGDRSTSKDHLMSMGSADQLELPLTAYLLTRVLPLMHMVFDPTSIHVADYVVPQEAKDQLGGRLYVVLLQQEACERGSAFEEGYCRDGNGVCVYVGCTGKPREHRFREHLIRYKHSKWVYQYGIRLVPELWQGTAAGIKATECQQYERELSLSLAAKGYCVRGGH